MNPKDSLMFDEEEIGLIDKCKRGANTAGYESSKDKREQAFFDTILNYGGQKLAFLLEIEKNQYDPKGRDDFKFYNIIGGEKTPYKH